MESDLPPDYQTIVNGTTNEPKINEILSNFDKKEHKNY